MRVESTLRKTLNDPRAGTAVFACALLLAGAIGAAVMAPARAPKASARAPLPLADTLTIEDRRLAPLPDDPADWAPAMSAQRWAAISGREIGRVQITEAATEPVPMFRRPRPVMAESEQELVTSKPAPARTRREPQQREARDLCERHGLRKTWVSKSRWRCR
jgi:hypothetical protein